MQFVLQWIQYLAAGLAVGAFSGLLGVGGGILMVPLIYYIWRQDPKIAIGTSLATMVPTAISGAVTHLRLGHVNLTLAACLAVGAVLGSAFIGAPLTAYLPGETLKRIFGVFLLVVGLQFCGVLGWLVKLVQN